MAASKLDVERNGQDSSADKVGNASYDSLRSDLEDNARESDAPAPPYSTWPTAGQEEAAQRDAPQNLGLCHDLHVQVDKQHCSITSSDDEGAVAALSARSTRILRKRRGRSHFKSSPASSRSFGIYLGQAPQISPDAFIGRTTELQQLQDWLSPKTHHNHQRVVSILGMGGMGKTQLSLAHVRDCADKYSSVFWLNAKDETSLVQSIVQLSAVIFHESPTPAAQSTDDEKLKVVKFRRWLSEAENDRWLLIFDNYDNPRLPGMSSSTGYDIRGYFPHRTQGSILITTRSPRLQFTKQLRLDKLKDMKQSLAILAAGSGRTIEEGKIKSLDDGE